MIADHRRRRGPEDDALEERQQGMAMEMEMQMETTDQAETEPFLRAAIQDHSSTSISSAFAGLAAQLEQQRAAFMLQLQELDLLPGSAQDHELGQVPVQVQAHKDEEYVKDGRPSRSCTGSAPAVGHSLLQAPLSILRIVEDGHDDSDQESLDPDQLLEPRLPRGKHNNNSEISISSNHHSFLQRMLGRSLPLLPFWRNTPLLATETAQHDEASTTMQPLLSSTDDKDPQTTTNISSSNKLDFSRPNPITQHRFRRRQSWTAAHTSLPPRRRGFLGHGIYTHTDSDDHGGHVTRSGDKNRPVLNQRKSTDVANVTRQARVKGTFLERQPTSNDGATAETCHNRSVNDDTFLHHIRDKGHHGVMMPMEQHCSYVELQGQQNPSLIKDGEGVPRLYDSGQDHENTELGDDYDSDVTSRDDPVPEYDYCHYEADEVSRYDGFHYRAPTDMPMGGGGHSGGDNHNHKDDDSKTLKAATTPWGKQWEVPPWTGRVSNTCGAIVNNPVFSFFIISLIGVNAMTMGLETFDFICDHPDRIAAIETLDVVFLGIFTVELAIQFGYHGYHLFFNGWLLFDFIVIVVSWALEGAPVQALRSFRAFRALRLVARIPLLRTLVLAVSHVLPRIYAILWLEVLLLYIYSVLCTILFGDVYSRGVTEADFFSTLGLTMFTLFQFLTLEGFGSITRQVGQVYPYAPTVLVSFMLLTSFILYSLIVAVFCDSFLVTHRRVTEGKKARAAAKKIRPEGNKTENRPKTLLEEIQEREELERGEQSSMGITRVEVTASFSERHVLREKQAGSGQTPPAADNNRRDMMTRFNSGLTVRSIRSIAKPKADNSNYCWNRRGKMFTLPLWMRTASKVCGVIVENRFFMNFIVVIITLNSFTLGLATFDFVDDNPQVNSMFETIDLIFLIIFTVELWLHFLHKGYTLFFHGWLVFDLCTVAFSWWVVNIQVFRGFRVVRSVRLLVRIPILKTLVTTVLLLLPRIFYIFCLMTLIGYVYAVMCTVLFHDLYQLGFTDNDYFGSLDLTAFTLFQMVTLDWATIVRQVVASNMYDPFLVTFIFNSYLTLSGFLLYKMIVAIFCDSFIEAQIERRRKQKLKREQRRRERALRRARRRKKGAEKTRAEKRQKQLRQQQKLVEHLQLKRDFDDCLDGKSAHMDQQACLDDGLGGPSDQQQQQERMKRQRVSDDGLPRPSEDLQNQNAYSDNGLECPFEPSQTTSFGPSQTSFTLGLRRPRYSAAVHARVKLLQQKMRQVRLARVQIAASLERLEQQIEKQTLNADKDSRNLCVARDCLKLFSSTTQEQLQEMVRISDSLQSLVKDDADSDTAVETPPSPAAGNTLDDHSADTGLESPPSAVEEHEGCDVLEAPLAVGCASEPSNRQSQRRPRRTVKWHDE